MGDLETFVEVVFARAEGQRGRYLRIGQQGLELDLLIHDIFTNRLGANGVTDVRDADGYWLGIPILDNYALAYYLFGRFSQPTTDDRAAPFHGCLLTAADLENHGYDLAKFIAAWRKLSSAHSDWLGKGAAGQVKLALNNITDLQHGYIDPRQVEESVQCLVQGQLLRLPHKETVFALLANKVFQKSAGLAAYAWSTAPFAFPAAHDGAQLHIALAMDGKYMADRYMVRPLSLQDAARPAIAHRPLLRPEVEDYPSAAASAIIDASFRQIATAFAKPLKYTAIGSVAILCLILAVTFIGTSAPNDLKGIMRVLEPSNYSQSLDKNFEAIREANQLLHRQDTNLDSRASNDLKELMDKRVTRVQQDMEETLANGGKLNDPQFKTWLQLIGELERGKALRNGLFSKAKLIYKQTLDAIGQPSSAAVQQLDTFLQETGTYPELQELQKSAKDRKEWFNTIILAQADPTNRLKYESYANFLESHPGSAYVEDAKNQKREHLTKWQNDETGKLKALYNGMIWRRNLNAVELNLSQLKQAFDEYQKVPGIRIANTPAEKITKTLTQLLDGEKIIYLSINDFKFEEDLKDKISKIECEVNQSIAEPDNNGFSMSRIIPKPLRPCKIDQRIKITANLSTEKNTAADPIKDHSNLTNIYLPAPFHRETPIWIKKESKILATAKIPDTTFEGWILHQNKTQRLEFRTDDGEGDVWATAVLMPPKLEELGFPQWN